MWWLSVIEMELFLVGLWGKYKGNKGLMGWLECSRRVRDRFRSKL